MVFDLLSPFKQLIHMIASKNCPMSAYFPGCLAVYNELSQVLIQNNGKLFDHELEECQILLKSCFNFSGNESGILQLHHLWCFNCDPFSRRLEFDMDSLIGGFGLSGVISKMINWACPNDIIDQVTIDFNFFYTGSGLFMGKFKDDVIHSPWNQPVMNNTITLSKVSEWISSTGGHEARLAWFAVNAKHSIFYRNIALPLMSLCFSGSMVIDRIAPQLNESTLGTTLSKRSIMQVRSGLNLRFLKDATSQPSLPSLSPTYVVHV